MSPACVDDYLFDVGPDDADLTDPDTYLSGVPHATLARLRRDDPVHWTVEADGSGFWSVTRYHDALKVSRDVKTFTSSQGVRLERMDPEQLEARRTLMEHDPPEHTRLRRLLSKGFSRRTIAGYEGTIRSLAAEVLEQAIPMVEFDFVTEIAQQLPMRMLGRLLGASDEDGHRLVAWGDALLGNMDPEFTDHPVDLSDTEEYRMVPFRSPAALEVFEYAQRQAADRRAHPRDDIITKLLEPTTDGEPLTDDEFNNFFALIVVAGNDTTRYTIAHGLWTLMNHPHLWDAWRNNATLTETAVEEILRTTSPTMHFRRTATTDLEMYGSQIRTGDRVVIWFNSANHDDRAFERPFRFDLRRAPNDHMAFGRNGPHHCLGAWLARLEIKVVFEELMARVESIEQTGPLERLRSNFIAGIKHLPVRVSRC